MSRINDFMNYLRCKNTKKYAKAVKLSHIFFYLQEVGAYFLMVDAPRLLPLREELSVERRLSEPNERLLLLPFC